MATTKLRQVCPATTPALVARDVESESGAQARPQLAMVRQAPAAFYYSSAVEGDLSQILGAPHYSYRFAEQKFLRAFAERGVLPGKLKMPEYYNDVESLTNNIGTPPENIVHVIFRSTEQIRLLKIGYNIACFAWEFEVLKDESRPGEHPFLNQCRMLSICDEVWVPCRFTRDVLERHGINNVHIIPAPIGIPPVRLERYNALAVIGHLGVMPLIINFILTHQENSRAVSAQAESMIDWLAPRLIAGKDALVYLAVLNPWDFRKNLDALLRGFHHFQQMHKDVCLIVKLLTAAGGFTLEQVISAEVLAKLAEGSVFNTANIVFINRYLSDDEMSALYGVADYYVSTSVAEGQNLPLLEAMAHGTIPVSTSNTAMADYIKPDNAFLIAERVVANTSAHMAGTIAGKPFNIHVSSSRDVFSALMQSRAATPARRRKMATACVATVKAQFSAEAVWPMIAQRIAAVAASRARGSETEN